MGAVKSPNNSIHHLLHKIKDIVNKRKTFHIHLLVESFCIIFQKCILRQGFWFCFVLNFFLIFDQISDSCSSKIVLYKRESVDVGHYILATSHYFNIWIVPVKAFLFVGVGGDSM